MEQLINHVKYQCSINLPLTKRKFEMLKRTSKDFYYLFLPLTKKETIDCWQKAIKEFEDGNK